MGNVNALKPTRRGRRKAKRKGKKVKYDFAPSVKIPRSPTFVVVVGLTASLKDMRGDDIGNLIESTAAGDSDSLREGIHSLAWALAIAEQPNCPLLKLPPEIRQQIWQYVIFGFDRSDRPIIYVERHGVRFIDGYLSPIISICAKLSRVCRRMYVDIVGSALLYKRAVFSIPGPATVASYLAVIIPERRDAINSLRIRIPLRTYGKVIPDNVLTTLAALKSLRALEVIIVVYCSESYNRNPDVTEAAFRKLSNIHWELLKGCLREFKLEFQWAVVNFQWPARSFPLYTTLMDNARLRRLSAKARELLEC
ncbi:uncharacterized protein BP5553_07164 [Venustampulla echinocandica]|uniref:DUF7730 domain-containing protein n=1 Tax=Venustampulla echinocandica TaxID=2656787 RepID=A0A370TIQ6_9HELO|nr:uncharacterized protein BP5553_07164 [Venustampulla echinocandica]RDL35233.1 hypothetical protein BP5553_07164 [Venustampulla echinocandica]